MASIRLKSCLKYLCWVFFQMSYFSAQSERLFCGSKFQDVNQNRGPQGGMPKTVFGKSKSAENWCTRVFLGVDHEYQLCLSWSHQKRMVLKIAVSYIQQTCRNQLRRRIFQTTMLPSAHAPSRLWERSWPRRVSHPGAMRAPRAHKQYRTPVQAAEFSYSVGRS